MLGASEAPLIPQCSYNYFPSVSCYLILFSSVGISSCLLSEAKNVRMYNAQVLSIFI